MDAPLARGALFLVCRLRRYLVLWAAFSGGMNRPPEPLPSVWI